MRIISKKNRHFIFLLIGLVCGLSMIPLFIKDAYILNLLVLSGIHGVAVLGLYVVFGLCGQISLGQAGFALIGVYVAGLLEVKYQLPPIIGLIAAMSFGVIAGFLIGLPCLRLKGHYLAMGTLAFGIGIEALIKAFDITGGPEGFGGIPILSFFSIPIVSEKSYFYLLLILLTIVSIGVLFLERSKYGRAMKWIHIQEDKAKLFGVNANKIKILAFMLSAFLASLAGYLHVHHLGYAGPDSFTFETSVLYVVMLIFGGQKHIGGALIGAVLLTIIPEFLKEFKEWHTFLFGLILILSIRYYPQGLMGVIQKSVFLIKAKKYFLK